MSLWLLPTMVDKMEDVAVGMGWKKYILSEHIVMGHILKWNTQKANTQVHCKTGSKRKRREKKKREKKKERERKEWTMCSVNLTSKSYVFILWINADVSCVYMSMPQGVCLSDIIRLWFRCYLPMIKSYFEKPETKIDSSWVTWLWYELSNGSFCFIH